MVKRFHYALWVTLFLLVVFNCVLSGESDGAKPEKVYRIVYVQKPNEWYIQQAELWKKEIDKNPKNPEAWYNYYNAVRYANYEGSIGTEEKRARLKQIIDDMNKAIPGTYECYLLTYWNSYNVNDLSLIDKAYQLRPDQPDTYYPYISHYELLGPETKLKEFCEKLYQSKDIAPGLVSYNYNVLMSTDTNAILFTNGDNDTYPIWMLQNALDIRKDVTLLNVSLCRGYQDYLERNLKEKGITVDFDKLPDRKDDNFFAELCKTIGVKYPNIPVYFALTVYENITKPITDDLYIVGLAYQYSPERIDNLALLKKNLENNLLLDYLKYDWYDDSYLAKDIITHMNLNYIAPMVMLAEHYNTCDETKKAEDWKGFALLLAFRAGKNEMADEIEKKFR
jgi:hypothetical protein